MKRPPEGLTSKELAKLGSYDPNDEDMFLKVSKSSLCPMLCVLVSFGGKRYN